MSGNLKKSGGGAQGSARGKKPPEMSRKLTPYQRYMAFSYRHLGGFFEDSSRAAYYSRLLRYARINQTAGLFLSTVAMSCLIAFGAGWAAAVLILFALKIPLWWLLSLGVAGLAAAVVYMGFHSSLSVRISTRREELEKELPFTLSELSILSSTGISPMEIIRKMSTRDTNRYMADEMKSIVYKVEVEGKDLITALSQTAFDSPSKRFREALWDLSNLIHQGGNLDAYLRSKADEIFKTKRDVQREFIDKLLAYADVYLTVTLLGVLLLVMGAFLMDATGGGGALTPDMLLILLIYIIIPIVMSFVGFLISSAYKRRA